MVSFRIVFHEVHKSFFSSHCEVYHQGLAFFYGPRCDVQTILPWACHRWGDSWIATAPIANWFVGNSDPTNWRHEWLRDLLLGLHDNLAWQLFTNTNDALSPSGLGARKRVLLAACVQRHNFWIVHAIVGPPTWIYKLSRHLSFKFNIQSLYLKLKYEACDRT